MGDPNEMGLETDSELNHEELYDLAEWHGGRFQSHGELIDIDKAIEYGTRALELTPEDHPDLSERHASLGISYTDQFQRLGELDDLEKAIEHKTCALNLTPNGHPDSAHRHAELGLSYTHRFQWLGQLNDLEIAIAHNTRALELTPDDHPDLSDRHASIGVSYTDRFQHIGELEDLEKAIEHKIRALELIPDDHSDLSHRHAELGISYGHRFQRLGEIGDLEKAIERKVHALELTPDDHPELSRRHASLGISYGGRFQRLGELDDLEKAIAHKICALELTPDSHPDLSDRHASLGVSYTNRFQHIGELNDLEKATKHNIRALELTPEGHSDLSKRHANLGISYTDRFQRLGKFDDLEKAVEHQIHALKLTPYGHPDLSDRHASLGVSYTHLFQRLGGLDDLEKAIQHDSHALQLTPDGHPDLSDRHDSLGVSYGDRFQRLGALDDLDKAIEHDSCALELTPNGHRDLPRRHTSLGVSYTNRYWRLGELTDLEKAIQHKIYALELSPDDHPDLSLRHAHLGVSYNDRFQRLGKLDDLDKAIIHDSHALELTPEGHPDLSRRHANLGASYIDRFQRAGELEDLEKAIQYDSRALEFTPDGHPELSRRHGSLGVSYSCRFRCLGEPDDLDKAIKHDLLALEMTPDGHPDLPTRYFNQAQTFLSQYQYNRNSHHLEASMGSFRNASQLLTGPPRSKFRYAVHWATVASSHTPQSPTCIEAYQTAINLLPQSIWLGATASQRYFDLSTATNLAVNSAFAAILHSNNKLALEWLEHARCVVWNQTIMIRSPIDNLRSSYPDLATRLQAVSKQLHAASPGPSVSRLLPSTLGPDNVYLDRYRLSREYDDLMSQIRNLPGYEAFLLPMKVDRLALAARNGPIVMVNCHIDQCDALVILPGQDDVMRLPLPNFTQAKARSARAELESALWRKGIRERGIKARKSQEPRHDIGRVLEALWHHVVKPVLDFLGYTTVLSISPPHITWCPTGPLSFLPLHAAGDYDQPGSRVFDYVISSYTPTLAALLTSTPTSLDRPPRVLAIGQAQTPGCSPLPGTMNELACVKSHSQNKAEYTQLIGSEATTTKVLDAMEQHDWVHLACHAHQNVSDPTKSGFFLHDGTLDLASINRRSFSNKGLAFLSACQTAMGDQQLPDEVVHLASSMLTAGYPSVIATMWSVGDSDAPLVADKVYSELMKEGKLGNGAAGKALHHAVAALRDKVGEKEFARWVPYIHIGR